MNDCTNGGFPIDPVGCPAALARMACTLVLLLSALIYGHTASAHALAPSLLQLSAGDDGVVAVSWKTRVFTAVLRELGDPDLIQCLLPSDRRHDEHDTDPRSRTG